MNQTGFLPVSDSTMKAIENVCFPKNVADFHSFPGLCKLQSALCVEFFTNCAPPGRTVAKRSIMLVQRPNSQKVRGYEDPE